MSKMEDGLIVAKLKDGEDFFESLREEVLAREVRSGLILSGIGMLRELRVGYFMGGGKYVETSVPHPVELTSMQGNIATTEEGVAFHIHLNGATREGMVVGGHLVSAKVNVVNEIVILRLDRIELRRKLNERTGLLELVILNEPASPQDPSASVEV